MKYFQDLWQDSCTCKEDADDAADLFAKSGYGTDGSKLDAQKASLDIR